MSKKFIDPTRPAYPTSGYQPGMDLRTAIAMDMAKGILAGRNTTILTENDMCMVVGDAIRMADKLIEQLGKI